MWANSGPIPKKNEKINTLESFYENIQRTQLGFKAKRILNIGRALFLKQMGFKVKFSTYCSLSVSPENLFLFGKNINS